MDIENPKYGDETTADLMLRLLDWNGTEFAECECEDNPIYLHSHLLILKSEYFKTLLSGRWSSAQDHPKNMLDFKAWFSGRWSSPQDLPNNMLDFTINRGNTADEYIRCIQLLYAPKRQRHFLLSGVSETLKILQVASEWRIGEAADACMEYLEAIPWRDDEALQIKSLLSSLQIEVGPNLSARLCPSQSQYLKCMEAELKQMLSYLCDRGVYEWDRIGNKERFQTACYKLVAANCGKNCSKQLKDLTKSLVLQEARHMLKSCKGVEDAKILLWYIRTLRSLEITEYVSVLGDVIDVYNVIRSYEDTDNGFLNLLDDAFKEMASGKLVLQRKDRLKFVTNWLLIIQFLPDDFKEKIGELHTSLKQGLDSVISTLPAEDYILISKAWDQGRKDLYSTPAYSNWIEKVRSGCKNL